MPILGVGLDVVDLVRFRRTLDRLGEPFVGRIFTEREAAYAARSPRRRIERLGARFAAKEAFGKALGVGMTERSRWQEIEVTHDTHGRPTLTLHGQTAAALAGRGAVDLHLSLSHDGDVAAAVVVMEGEL